MRVDGVNDALGGSYFRNKATIADRLTTLYKAQSVTKPTAYMRDAISVTKLRMRFFPSVASLQLVVFLRYFRYGRVAVMFLRI